MATNIDTDPKRIRNGDKIQVHGREFIANERLGFGCEYIEFILRSTAINKEIVIFSLAFGEVWLYSACDPAPDEKSRIAIKRTRSIFSESRRSGEILESPRDAVVTLRELRLLKRLKRSEGDDSNPGPSHICSLIEIYSPVIYNNPRAHWNFDADVQTLFPKLGDFYLSFEVMETNLEKLLLSHSLSLEDAVSIMYQLLLGLKYIHSANVIHRDLKPANTMVTLWKEEFHSDPHYQHLRGKTNYVAAIIDFGLARSMKPGDMMDEHIPDPADEKVSKSSFNE